MATSNSVHILNNVEALYPRLNTTYKYDTKANDGKGQSVPCEPLDEGAKYELNYRMDKDQAVGLYKDMKAAYNARKAANWPEMPSAKEVFEVQEDGTFVAKSSLKGSYNNELTRKPRQFDARNQLLPDDFQLTTGSTINSQLALIPYSSEQRQRRIAKTSRSASCEVQRGRTVEPLWRSRWFQWIRRWWLW